MGFQKILISWKSEPQNKSYGHLKFKVPWSPYCTYVVVQVSSLNDGRDFDAVRGAMKVLGYSTTEVDTIWKLLASILHMVRATVTASLYSAHGESYCNC